MDKLILKFIWKGKIQKSKHDTEEGGEGRGGKEGREQ